VPLVVALIDAVVRCTVCGKPPGCTCWVRLKCTGCSRTLLVRREPDDDDAEELETKCPECAE
jgi:DNA-directed RNA polymerase subunit RPC12/RpoP